MVRVSEYFRLHRQQPTLDFVDVDIATDVRMFVDPRALRLLRTEWGKDCVALVQDFFAVVMEAIRNSENDVAHRLLRTLREPNETHLGLSIAKSRGRALGHESARDVWQALSTSEAAKSGLLEDLEDTVLFVDGISTDIISDITTNIIRQPLIHYTQVACRWYGIPLTPDVDSGPMWDPNNQNWFSEYVDLPMVPTGKLLLVPKAIVRRRLEYDADEYYRYYILEHLQQVELEANSELVEILRSGQRRVTKKALEEKYGCGKSVNLRETREDPSLLTRYRNHKRENMRPPLDHETLALEVGTSVPDWQTLLNDVRSLPSGRDNANNYERAIEGLITALFYPALSNPVPQTKIHEGRKRIDITYSNIATTGFFYWLGQHYPAPYVFVECKNYAGDPANPELDQLSGRFSPQRGQFGILICRNIVDKKLFATRCRDTARDHRGFIVYLDDDDLEALVTTRQDLSPEQIAFGLLKTRFDALIM